jgi:hypothetical protein
MNAQEARYYNRSAVMGLTSESRKSSRRKEQRYPHVGDVATVIDNERPRGEVLQPQCSDGIDE